MKWDAKLYEQKHGFVAEYGESLLPMIPVNPKQSILDIGCGTGTLTAMLGKKGGRVVGIDSSADMIEEARKLHPEIEFQTKDALNLEYQGEWDVIFSNAVFHWIRDQKKLLEQVSQALRPGGLLVCEFGAEGNIAVIEKAFQAVLAKRGVSYSSKFCFPATEKFCALAESAGLTVENAFDFDRPTPLKEGAKGLDYWARQFYRDELEAFTGEEQEKILAELEEETRQRLYNGQEWVADYRRLRMAARKRG